MNTPRSRAAFSLIEMLAVIGMIAVFMTLLSFHLVGLSNIWLSRSDDDFFQQHVDGVTLFLANAIEAAEGVDGKAGAASEGPSLPVEWARPPGFSDLDDPLLYFRQPEAPALFVREGTSLPDINCYLVFDEREGLSIMWYSNLEAEDVEDERDLRISPVSSFVTKFEYAYYEEDDDDWEITEDPLEGDDDAFVLPHFIRLTFSHPDEEDIQRSIYLPQRNNSVPLF